MLGQSIVVVAVVVALLALLLLLLVSAVDDTLIRATRKHKDGLSHTHTGNCSNSSSNKREEPNLTELS